jgi:hypothetical protein
MLVNTIVTLPGWAVSVVVSKLRAPPESAESLRTCAVPVGAVPAGEEELAAVLEAAVVEAVDSVALVLEVELLELPQPAASAPAAKSATAAVPRMPRNLFIANLQLVA